MGNCQPEKINVDQSVFRIPYIHTLIRRQSSIVNRTRINSAQTIFFWEYHITRRQAISPIAKFHHVLGRGFMIQRVILILIKCLSANQIQLFLHESTI